MYDWDALWHEHEGFRTGYNLQHNDSNDLADALQASLIKPAKNTDDIAVYETDDNYLLAGHDNGLQLLEVSKHQLFDLTIRLVTEQEASDKPLPYIEIHVDNLALEIQAVWQGSVTLGDDNTPYVEELVIGGDTMPNITFGNQLFEKGEVFSRELKRVWHEEIPQLIPLIQTWFIHGTLPVQGENTAYHYGDEQRVQEICDRYAEIVRREQALLSRRFNDQELTLLAGVIASISFETPASCRGLWLAVEAWLIDHDTIDPAINADALLDKMKALSFSQEIALIEALAPLER